MQALRGRRAGHLAVDDQDLVGGTALVPLRQQDEEAEDDENDEDDEERARVLLQRVTFLGKYG